MTAGRTVIGNSRDWCTPIKYVQAVREVLGEIDLDPCSNEWSHVGAGTEWKLPHDDGLKHDWRFSSIYVNPPYGSDPVRGTRIFDWLCKCSEAHTEYGSEVIALVPIAANTKHWKMYVWPTAASVCFLYDTRVRFLVRGRDDGKGSPMACAAVYWGKNKSKFAEVFRHHGAVVDLQNVSLPGDGCQPTLELVRYTKRISESAV
jgi:DNA N-6-adenine-methyltransferase (Dam)